MFNYTATSAIAAILFASANAASGVFDYSELGAEWGEDVPLCKYGQEQSPIDLSVKGASGSDKMELNGFGYRDYVQRTVKRTDHTIVVDATEGEFELNFFDGSQSAFVPLQFHFHSPSEHTVNGKNYDLELHVVHKYKDTTASLGAVIGIFFDRAEGGDYDNDFITSLKFGDTEKGDTGIKASNVNLASLLSTVDMRKYWNYRGSLTTPPCTEGIKWTVLEKVQPISGAQLEAFAQYFALDADYAGGNGNNREVQPLLERTLYYSAAESSATNLMTVFASMALVAAASLF